LVPGDSGCWIKDELNGDVYGHVVCLDIFGEASVVPLKSTLEDIRLRTQAEAVSLAEREDLISLHGIKGPRDKTLRIPSENSAGNLEESTAKVAMTSSLWSYLRQIPHSWNYDGTQNQGT
jgi:hypothetical protein